MRRRGPLPVLLAWLLALTALPAIGPEDRAAPPPPDASSFSQLFIAHAPARTPDAPAVIVLRVRVRVAIRVGIGDPVNRWDPSGLYWRLVASPKRMAWKWIDEGPDRPKYDIKKVPSSLRQAAYDLLSLAPKDGEKHYINITQDDGLVPSFGWPKRGYAHFVNLGESTQRIEVFSPGRWSKWDEMSNANKVLWAREYRKYTYGVAEQQAGRYNVPVESLLSVVAGEVIDQSPVEKEIEDNNDIGYIARSVIGVGKSVGPAQLRLDSLKSLNIWPELTDNEKLIKLTTYEGAFDAAAQIHGRILDDIARLEWQGSLKGGVEEWLGGNAMREILEVGNMRGRSQLVQNKKVSAEFCAFLALSQNNITTPDKKGVNSLGLLSAVPDDGKTFEQGNAQIGLQNYTGGFFAPNSYIWDPNDIAKQKNALRWLSGLPPTTPVILHGSE